VAGQGASSKYDANSKVQYILLKNYIILYIQGNKKYAFTLVRK